MGRRSGRRAGSVELVAGLDSSFAQLPRRQLAEAALAAAADLGAEAAEVRVEHIRTQLVQVRDHDVETALDDVELGLGIRVLHHGSFGFAATVELHPEAAAAAARQAVALARATAAVGGAPSELAAEPGVGTVEWISAFDVDPTAVPLADKVARLLAWSATLLEAAPVDHVSASVMAVSEHKHFADLSGNVAVQRRVRIHPVVEVFAAGTDGFESMRTLAPPAGRGWEYLEGTGCDLAGEVEQLPELLAEKLAAPSVEPGPYDLVIDPSNLWLTIHESIGHATELDRALGYEAAYAGTSFATPDRLGSLRYGAPSMHVTGDRTIRHGLATVAVDDEGVPAGAFDLVRDGVLVGYQLDRTMAAEGGLGRSNGCAFADSPLHIPMQRMANVSLQPVADGPGTGELITGTDRGIYVVGDKSWSIDMQRYNFQFTGQRFYRIDRGRLAGQLRDVAYQATTTDFWGAMDAVGGPGTWVLGGAMNCGKGQPGQVAPVSHGCPAARFRHVNVLNTRGEAGR